MYKSILNPYKPNQTEGYIGNNYIEAIQVCLYYNRDSIVTYKDEIVFTHFSIIEEL